MWDSGQVASARRYDVAYAGPALQSRTRYYWRVKAWTAQDGGTAWAYCATAAFAWQPDPMALPGKTFQPGFCIPGVANQGAANALGPSSRFQVQPAPNNCDPTRAATAHAGGMQVGLVDGSVRTLAPSLSGTTWAAAVTRAGGEVLGSDW